MSHFYNIKTPTLGKKERIALILLCAALLVWLYYAFLHRPTDYNSLLNTIKQHYSGNGEAYTEIVKLPYGIAEYSYIELNRSMADITDLDYETYLLKKCIGELYVENQQQTFPYPAGSICNWYQIKDSNDDILLISKNGEGQLALWYKNRYFLDHIISGN